MTTRTQINYRIIKFLCIIILCSIHYLWYYYAVHNLYQPNLKSAAAIERGHRIFDYKPVLKWTDDFSVIIMYFYKQLNDNMSKTFFSLFCGIIFCVSHILLYYYICIEQFSLFFSTMYIK